MISPDHDPLRLVARLQHVKLLKQLLRSTEDILNNLIHNHDGFDEDEDKESPGDDLVPADPSVGDDIDAGLHR